MHGGVILSITRKQKSSKTLDGHNFPFRKPLSNFPHHLEVGIAPVETREIFFRQIGTLYQ